MAAFVCHCSTEKGFLSASIHLMRDLLFVQVSKYNAGDLRSNWHISLTVMIGHNLFWGQLETMAL